MTDFQEEGQEAMGTRCSLSQKQLGTCCSVACSFVSIQVNPTSAHTAFYEAGARRQFCLYQSKAWLCQARKNATKPARCVKKRGRRQELVLPVLRVVLIGFCLSNPFGRTGHGPCGPSLPTLASKRAGGFEAVGRHRHEQFSTPFNLSAMTPQSPTVRTARASSENRPSCV